MLIGLSYASIGNPSYACVCLPPVPHACNLPLPAYACLQCHDASCINVMTCSWCACSGMCAPFRNIPVCNGNQGWVGLTPLHAGIYAHKPVYTCHNTSCTSAYVWFNFFFCPPCIPEVFLLASRPIVSAHSHIYVYKCIYNERMKSQIYVYKASICTYIFTYVYILTAWRTFCAYIRL